MSIFEFREWAEQLVPMWALVLFVGIGMMFLGIFKLLDRRY